MLLGLLHVSLFLRIREILNRICERGAVDFGEGNKRTLSWTYDVLRVNSMNQQGIRAFGTHQRDPLLICRLDQFFEALLKLSCLHVIHITSKRSISPAYVDRICPPEKPRSL